MSGYDGFEALEREGWTDPAIADGYVTRFARASDMAVPAVVRTIPEGASVLDLCCGQGNVTKALYDAGFSVAGADFSSQMLDHARARLPEVDFIEADAQSLPFPADSFDAVTCTFGIMHIPDQPKALSEVARILKPGGTFTMTAWCGPDRSQAFATLYPAVVQHADPSRQMPDQPDFHRFANETVARDLLVGAGLAMTRHQVVPCHWDLTAPEELAEIFHKGAPRGGKLMSIQPSENLAAIKAAMAAKVRAEFAHGDGWRVEIPAAMVVALKPS
ncbi:MAG: methyltransferase domain-containing protein [Pseudomonadota bacterium]